jgi:hypothetical protein
MNKMDIQKKFEEVRDDFRVKKKEFEEGKYRDLTQKDLDAHPQPLLKVTRASYWFLSFSPTRKLTDLPRKSSMHGVRWP